MTNQSRPNPENEVAPDTVAPTPSDEFVPPLPVPVGGVAQPAPLPPPLPAPFGRYTLNKLLGRGGMGAVYLAHDRQLDRPVALKIPRFGVNPSVEDEERFLREARAAAMLSHPNLCPVYDVGQIGGVSYLTMAYIEGQSLAEMIREGCLPPPPELVRLVAQMALAMQEAHRRGVIHRDLKPANVMIDLRGQPVITDFGLARRGPETGDVRLTHSGMVMGTPAYMPPEQVNGAVHAVGPACDIYSLGVILYELLAGRLPFLGAVGDLMAQIVTVAPPPPSQFRPGLAAELDTICLKALAKDPARRFASMQEFAAALQGHVHGGERSGGDAGDAWVASTPGGKGRAPTPPEVDERDRLCLAARYFLDKRTEESNRKSIATWYQILDKDPTFAPAWAGLAFAYHLLGVRGHASPTVTSRPPEMPPVCAPPPCACPPK
jgi:predicted Ser/Thr protein kinase